MQGGEEGGWKTHPILAIGGSKPYLAGQGNRLHEGVQSQATYIFCASAYFKRFKNLTTV